MSIVGYEVLNGFIFITDTPLSPSDGIVIDPGILTALIEVMYEPVRPDICPAIAHVTFSSEPATKLPCVDKLRATADRGTGIKLIHFITTIFSMTSHVLSKHSNVT